ncbi:latrophilin-like protein LAT-2 [Diadema antillarum]|uniref:latrophilin-like protein LAT-2 n=1 Tax=Diadema antillarum TaxID=105358 RepID=UPI003A8410BE
MHGSAFNASVTVGVWTYTTLSTIVNDLKRDRQLNDDGRRVASDVISVSVFVGNESVSTDFSFDVELKIPDLESYLDPSCKFWDVRNRSWNSLGCVTKESSATTATTCECSHMTSFAVLMRVTPDDGKEDPIGDILTKVGLALSIATLSISLVIFFFLRLSLTADRIIVHANLMVAILIADIIFLAGIDQTSNAAACKAVAFLLQFFYTAVVCWMLVEGVHLYRQIIKVFESERPRTWLYFVVGWGIPAFLVGITGSLRFQSYGVGTACWLSVEDGSIWAFVAPAIPILLTNVVILILVIKTVIVASQKQKEMGKINLIKAGVRSSMLLMPLLGVPWLVGPFVALGPAFEILFSVLGTLQGFFIALFYCFMNSEVRGVIQQRIRKKRDSQAATFSSSEEKRTKSSTLNMRKVRVSPAPSDQVY